MTPIQRLPVDEEHARLVQDLRALAQIGELLVEDFAVVHARYTRLLTAGWAFTPEFRLLMKLLSVQARHTDDDPDSDVCVDTGFEDDRDNNNFGVGDSFDWLRDDKDPGVGSCGPLFVDTGDPDPQYWDKFLPDGVQQNGFTANPIRVIRAPMVR